MLHIQCVSKNVFPLALPCVCFGALGTALFSRNDGKSQLALSYTPKAVENACQWKEPPRINNWIMLMADPNNKLERPIRVAGQIAIYSSHVG